MIEPPPAGPHAPAAHDGRSSALPGTVGIEHAADPMPTVPAAEVGGPDVENAGGPVREDAAAASDGSGAAAAAPMARPPSALTTEDVLATFRSGFAVRDLAPAGLVALMVAGSGALTAWIWSALAPRVQVLMTADGPIAADIHTEDWVAGDLAYAAIGLVAGLLAALGAYRLRRWRGPMVLAGLMLGCLAAAGICAWLGPRFDAEAYRRLIEGAPVGTRFGRPADLRAYGLILVQPMAAVICYVVCAAWSRSPDLGTGPSEAPVPVAAGEGG